MGIEDIFEEDELHDEFSILGYLRPEIAFNYTGLETPTSSTVVDNKNRTISVNVDGLLNKLDKNTSQTSYNQVYAKSLDGSQTMFNVDNSDSTNEYTIPVRHTNGNIVLPSINKITEDNYAVSKGYIDSKEFVNQLDLNLAIADVPAVSMVVDELTNINGKRLTAYTATKVSGAYPYFEISNKTSGPLTIKIDAAHFMNALSGRPFVGEYDYDHPKYGYLITIDGTILKPQWSSETGLRLYIFQDGVATKSYVDNKTTSILNSEIDALFE